MKPLRHLLPQLLMTLLVAVSGSAIAKEYRASASSEAAYASALPLLEKYDAEVAEMERLHHAGTLKTEGQKHSKAAGEWLDKALPLLEKASAEHHPAAQYRLAMLYMLYMSREDGEKPVCALLESSLKEGFAPAALAMSNYCFAFVKTPQFIRQTEVAATQAERFEAYYPQPVSAWACENNTDRSMDFRVGSLTQFQADAWMLLALKTPQDKARKTEYLKKAAALGCDYAQQRLKERKTE